MAILSEKEQCTILGQPVTLPCGLVLPNKLIKVAMEEMLGEGGRPSELLEALYETWAEGGWGMVLSGNVQVSPDQLGTGSDVPVPLSLSSDAVSGPKNSFASWARAARSGSAPPSSAPSSSSSSAPQHRTINILQLNHPGRQSSRFFCGHSPLTPALAPSAVALSPAKGLLGKLLGQLLWGTPKEMTEEDIDEVVRAFVRGARVAKETGWDGVELHASHGYLLAQFMSPQTNLRSDAYGGSARKRLTLLFRLIDAIRADFPQNSGFCLGVKLNASDYVKGGLTEQDALDNVKWIAEHGGVDFVEISGGSYESPEFMSTSTADQGLKRPSSAAREAFFDTFSHRARWVLSTLPPSTLPSPVPLILLTGGLRTRLGMVRAVHSPTKSPPTADLIGLARPAAADPFLPRRLLSPTVPAAEARAPVYDALSGVRWLRALFGWITLAGPGLDILWHVLVMRQIALRRREEKRRQRELYGEEVDGEGEKNGGAVRAGAAGDAYPLSNTWVLAWRTLVLPIVPRWVFGLAGAVVVALIGKRWGSL
ncbi:hypothetical protein JCM6882_006783 [Rhodosporidiobolus microsporus]